MVGRERLEPISGLELGDIDELASRDGSILVIERECCEYAGSLAAIDTVDLYRHALRRTRSFEQSDPDSASKKRR